MKPSSASRGTGSSRKARIDRRASRNAGTRLTSRPPPHTRLRRHDSYELFVRRNLAARSPEEVLGGWTDQLPGVALPEPGGVEAAHDRHGHAGRLAHHQLG